MKKLFTTIHLVLLLFIGLGCSTEINESDYEFSGDSGVKVTFSAVINNQNNTPLGRATGTSWDVGDIIGITCGDKQMNVSYEYTGESENYFKSVDKTQEIWLMGTDEYEVSAYYPYIGADGTAPAAINVETKSENQITEIEREKIDFLYASSIANRENPNVELPFNHVMSRIVLTFKGDGIDLSNIDCYITGLKLEGSFNPNTGETSLNEESAIESVNQVLTEKNNYTMTALFLPQSLSPKGLLIEAGMNGVYYKVELAASDLPELKSGYSYNYTILAQEYSDNPIKLTITDTQITPWVNHDGGSITPDPNLAGTDAGVNPSDWGNIENEDIIPVEKN